MRNRFHWLRSSLFLAVAAFAAAPLSSGCSSSAAITCSTAGSSLTLASGGSVTLDPTCSYTVTQHAGEACDAWDVDVGMTGKAGATPVTLGLTFTVSGLQGAGNYTTDESALCGAGGYFAMTGDWSPYGGVVTKSGWPASGVDDAAPLPVSQSIDISGAKLNGDVATGTLVIKLSQDAASSGGGDGGGGDGGGGGGFDTGTYSLSASCAQLLTNAMNASFVTPKGTCGPPDGSGMVLPGYDWAGNDPNATSCAITNGDIAYAVDECWSAVCDGQWGHPDFAKTHDDNAQSYVADAQSMCGTAGQSLGNVTCWFEQIWQCP